jgi:PAT family beta-lactamase induction signal transducer AmpG
MAMAVLMATSLGITIWAPSPPSAVTGPQTLADAVVQPLVQFARRGVASAIFLLAFVIVFRMPDLLAARMTMPLLIKQLGFSPEEVGWIRQMLGFFLTIIGALIGGGLVARIGLMKGLIAFGLLQTASNAGFLVLANVEPSLQLMAVVIGVESICGGLVAAGFVAFLMSCCDRRYSATQYALLTACMAAAQAIGGSVTGYAVDLWGYGGFFLFTIIIGVPGLAMLPWLRRCVPDPSALVDLSTDRAWAYSLTASRRHGRLHPRTSPLRLRPSPSTSDHPV